MKKDVKKEALFNEVKGSLFEFLVGKTLAQKNNDEESFLHSVDRNYLTVLSQQDRMVRQFYPEMLSFLNAMAKASTDEIIRHMARVPHSPRLLGKLVNSRPTDQRSEADLEVLCGETRVPLSLKLNKRGAFVNTKSGGIRSFFSQYFSFIPESVQVSFNRFVDLEFTRMAVELHERHELEYAGDFTQWVKAGLSELPGELPEEDRRILKAYYARIAREMHLILSSAQTENPSAFRASLPPLVGFSDPEIVQVICFHEFEKDFSAQVEVHTYREFVHSLPGASLIPQTTTASVNFVIGNWQLQVRVKPMNKFTTTSMKINCSVKVTPPSGS